MTDIIMSQEENRVEGEDPIIPNEEQNMEAQEPSVSDNEGDSSELLKQLSEMQELLQQQKNEYLRAIADLDNMRRRMTREREELLRTAGSGIIEGFLPVMDNMLLGLDAAKRHETEGSEEIAKGFMIVLEQMRNVLKEHGSQLIDPKGEDFDPNLHESIALMPSDSVEEHKVLEVVRVGYSLNNRLLRPASVVVSSGPKTEK